MCRVAQAAIDKADERRERRRAVIYRHCLAILCHHPPFAWRRRACEGMLRGGQVRPERESSLSKIITNTADHQAASLMLVYFCELE
jgi:hypothetical protein